MSPDRRSGGPSGPTALPDGCPLPSCRDRPVRTPWDSVLPVRPPFPFRTVFCVPCETAALPPCPGTLRPTEGGESFVPALLSILLSYVFRPCPLSPPCVPAGIRLSEIRKKKNFYQKKKKDPFGETVDFDGVVSSTLRERIPPRSSGLARRPVTS